MRCRVSHIFCPQLPGSSRELSGWLLPSHERGRNIWTIVAYIVRPRKVKFAPSPSLSEPLQHQEPDKSRGMSKVKPLKPEGVFTDVHRCSPIYMFVCLLFLEGFRWFSPISLLAAGFVVLVCRAPKHSPQARCRELASEGPSEHA